MRNVAKKELLQFATNAEYMILKADVLLVSVGTPCREDGQADLQIVVKVANNIGKYMQNTRLL